MVFEFLAQKPSWSIELYVSASPEVESALHQGRLDISNSICDQSTAAKILLLLSESNLRCILPLYTKIRILPQGWVFGLLKRWLGSSYQRENSTFTTQNSNKLYSNFEFKNQNLCTNCRASIAVCLVCAVKRLPGQAYVIYNPTFAL